MSRYAIGQKVRAKIPCLTRYTEATIVNINCVSHGNAISAGIPPCFYEVIVRCHDIEIHAVVSEDDIKEIK